MMTKGENLYLNAVVVEIGHDDVIILVNGDVVRAGKLIFFVATGTELVQQLPVRLKDKDAVGLVVRDDDVAIVVNSDAFWS